jgi:thiamine biosynthesis lipoprotein
LNIPSEKFTRRFRAMGSPCEVRLRGGDEKFHIAVYSQILAELNRLEKRYSRFLPDSITTQINSLAGSGKSLIVDEETLSLFRYADTCHQQSQGLFDITSGSLRHLWNYQDLDDKQILPDASAINLALGKIGWGKVCWENGAVVLPIPGMEIDFGGIVKEYAADCLAGIAEKNGVVSGMVELGGDIRIFGMDSLPGNMPHYSPWRIGIRDPFNATKMCAVVQMQHGALATSGDYERYTMIGGKRYSHILNPLTGWPVESSSSVSVIADQCVLAGTAASIGLLFGKGGADWLEALGLPYLCIDQYGDIKGDI